MAILIDLYDNRSLTTAINKIQSPEPFVLDKLFSDKQFHSSDKIDIEIYNGSEKPAEFANRDQPEPDVIIKLTKTVQTVSIPRTYESKLFTVRELADIAVIGNAYSTDEARRAAQANVVARELTNLKDRVIRLREKMACDALSLGKIEVSQSNLEFKIDFKFVSTKQLITLTSTDLWSDAASKPTENIRKWKSMIMKASGVTPTTLLLGSDAASAFLNNAEVKAKLDLNNYRIGSLDLNRAGTLAANFIGTIHGVDIYEYTQQYVNASNVATDMIGTKKAILTGKGSKAMHLGPVQRIEGNSVKSYYSEFYLEVNERSSKSKLQWDLEQKSLPAIHDPGEVISATVLT